MIGDLLAVIGTSGTGFLEHDGYYRELGRFARRPAAQRLLPAVLRRRHARRAGPGRDLPGRPRRVRGPGRAASGRARACTSSSSRTSPRRARCGRPRERAGALEFNRQAPVVLPGAGPRRLTSRPQQRQQRDQRPGAGQREHPAHAGHGDHEAAQQERHRVGDPPRAPGRARTRPSTAFGIRRWNSSCRRRTSDRCPRRQRRACPARRPASGAIDTRPSANPAMHQPAANTRSAPRRSASRPAAREPTIMPPPQQLTMKPYAVPPASNSCSARATPATSVKAEKHEQDGHRHGRAQHHPVADQRDQPVAQLARQPVRASRPGAPARRERRRRRRSSPRTGRRPLTKAQRWPPAAMIAPTAAGASSVAVCWAAAKEDVAARQRLVGHQGRDRARWRPSKGAAPPRRAATRAMICQAGPRSRPARTPAPRRRPPRSSPSAAGSRSAITPPIGQISAQKPSVDQQRTRHPGGAAGHRCTTASATATAAPSAAAADDAPTASRRGTTARSRGSQDA